MARGKARPGRYGPRRQGGREEDDSNRWLSTYADAVTLLMAFFILLYAMSEIDVAKFAAFVEGLQVPFGNVAGEGLLPGDDALTPETDGLQPDHSPPPMAVTVSSDRVEAAERHAQSLEQLREVQRALDETLEARDLDQFVEQRIEERGLRVSIASDDILFALGSTRIDELGRQVIRAVSETLDEFPNPLRVEGHTDDVPLQRGDYTNWNLSTDRAVAVLSLMIEQYGLPPDRVGAAGYGEYRPLESNETSEGRARNRRVDIVVLIDEVI
jgi:chemotaxis protein MotB